MTPIETTLTTAADAGIDTAAKALESVVPHPAAPLVDAIIDQAASTLKTAVPGIIVGAEHEFAKFLEYIREHVLHLIPPIPAAVMALSNDDLRLMLEALANPHFDATDTYTTWAGWHSRNLMENATNLRNEWARRGLK